MSNQGSLDTDTGAAVMRRTADYQPPRSWRTWLIGRPLTTADAPHQSISKIVGLAVFSSDAMSSVAYAPQEMMLILAMAGIGMAAFQFALPLAMCTVFLLIILTISYRQTIYAYPSGGGAYIVARDNLGEIPAEVAGAALLIGYVLTVSVSIASGVAQLTSAMPELFPYRVWISVALVFLVMLINLRGVRESGMIFAVPTYYFIIMMFLTVVIGLFKFFTGDLPMVVDPPPLEVAHGAATGITLFLLLRAFSSGTTALTGVEAISNGIPAFKEPKSKNAATTLVWMSIILGVLMLAITFLAVQVGSVPSEEETVISQIARTVYDGRNLLYALVMAATTLILIMAANTAFADFPRLAALLAADGFLPRQLAFRGSRLVFSRGIIALAVIASLLIIIFNASVTQLIPLYAIGVFLSFTLSQLGMARRWWKGGQLAPGEELKERGSIVRYDAGWRSKMIVNGFGAFLTALVTLVFAVTKFRDGAWMVMVLIPALVLVFSAIHRHYRNLAKDLSLDEYGAPPRLGRHRVILPIGGVHRGTLAALEYAQTLSDDVTAVHVSMDPAEAERLQKRWEEWGEGVRLVVLDSPYRLLAEPLLEYIEEIEASRQPNDTITVVVPQFIPKHWWANALHTQTAFMLGLALREKPGVVVTNVPYQTH
jgi:amino acid transporter